MDKINLRYASINAKLKAMNAKTLNKEQMYNLARQSDLKSAIYILKSKMEELKNLSEDANREEIEEQLNNIRQKDIIKISRVINSKEKEFFNLFVFKYKVDSDEYKKYVEKIYKESKNLGKELQDMIGQRIDLLNIIYIYRLKKYYNMEKEKIKKYLINVNYKLSKNTIEKLLETNTFEDEVEILKSTKYAKIVENIKENQLELVINKYLYALYKKIFTEAKYNICTIIAYMYLEEYKKINIINILGGIYYNLPKEEIQNKIIL